MTGAELIAISNCLVIASIFALAACTAPPATQAPASRAATSEGIDLAGMDTSTKPGDDFFRYANGTWFKSTEIPQDRSSYGLDAKLTDEAN